MSYRNDNWFFLALCLTIPMIFAVIPVFGPIVGLLLLLLSVCFCLKGFVNVVKGNDKNPLIRDANKLDLQKNSSTLKQKKYIDENTRIKNLPIPISEKLSKMSQVSRELSYKLGRQPTRMEMANEMGIDQKELEDLISQSRPT